MKYRIRNRLTRKKPRKVKFNKVEKKDYEGNDIKQLSHFTDNIDALKATCSVRDDCVGFNSIGWLKNGLSDTSVDVEFDFYTKQ